MTVETRSRLQGMALVLAFSCGLAFGLDYHETRKLARSNAQDVRDLARLALAMSGRRVEIVPEGAPLPYGGRVTPNNKY